MIMTETHLRQIIRQVIIEEQESLNEINLKKAAATLALAGALSGTLFSPTTKNVTAPQAVDAYTTNAVEQGYIRSSEQDALQTPLGQALLAHNPLSIKPNNMHYASKIAAHTISLQKELKDSGINLEKFKYTDKGVLEYNGTEMKIKEISFLTDIDSLDDNTICYYHVGGRSDVDFFYSGNKDSVKYVKDRFESMSKK